MATLVLSALGTLIGGPVGGSIGALIGRSIDAKVLGGGGRQGPRLNELQLTSSSYGTPIPLHFGRMRVSGQIIWATDLAEHSDKQVGGKGGPAVTSYTYSASFAVALSSRPIGTVGRIWADGKLLRGEDGSLKVGGTFRLHAGHADQTADPLIAAAEGGGQCPAYRGLAYAVFEDLQLAEFGNRIPALSFEVIAETGPLSVREVIAGVIEDCDADIALDGVIGLSLDGPLVDTLAGLDPFYPINVDSSGIDLRLMTEDRRSSPIALPEAATSTNRDDFGGNAGYARRREREPETPVTVLRYYDRERDYLPGAQRAPGRPIPGQPRTIELPVTMTAPDARRAVKQAASRANWNRQTLSWRVTQFDPAARPGALAQVPGHPGTWRISDWEWRDQGFELSLTRLSPTALPGAGAADPGRANRPDDFVPGTTALTVCELPWDGASPTPLILALASSASPGWTGASLYAESGDGSLVPLGPSGRVRAILGAASDVLAARSPLLFDRHSAVTVTLIDPDMALSGATLQQLAMGANRALLGREIIQFSDVQALGGGIWRISGLLRGRGGTEAAIADHVSGERFALLDGTGTVLDSALLGALPDARVAAIGIADPDPVTTDIALAGIGNRPPFPVHGKWVSLPDGTKRLTWVRRARGAWLWLDGVDTPLGEQGEAYAITFEDVAGPIARWEVNKPQLDLSTTELAALITQHDTGWFMIRQQGDRALSEPLRANLPSA